MPKPNAFAAAKVFCAKAHIENCRFTEHIAILGQVLLCDLRKHLMDHKIHVLRGTSPVFVGNLMRAQERGHIAQRTSRIQAANHSQHLELVVERQPVPGFRFQSCRSAAQKPVGAPCGGFKQLVFGSGPRLSDSRSDAPAGSGNFLVRGAARPLLEFVDPRAGKDRVRVRVDKPRENHPIARVQNFAV